MCLLVSQLLVACGGKDRLPVTQSSVSHRQPGGKLDHQIPPPAPGQYSAVRSARDWRNPYLVIRAEGVEVLSGSAAAQRRVVACEELAGYLESLPVTSWPYGRVVAVQGLGIRRGDGRDARPIAENKAKVERVLAELELKVDWWPS